MHHIYLYLIQTMIFYDLYWCFCCLNRVKGASVDVSPAVWSMNLCHSPKSLPAKLFQIIKIALFKKLPLKISG